MTLREKVPHSRGWRARDRPGAVQPGGREREWESADGGSAFMGGKEEGLGFQGLTLYQ